jgi:hypothetical protein
VVARRCGYDNLAAAVRKIVCARRELTGRFLALVSHYLFEPDFTRIGEGHDKGGVESRGKAIRLEQLTPIPCGDSLEAISRQLLVELDAAFAARPHAGRSATECGGRNVRNCCRCRHELRGAQANPGRDQLARDGQDRRGLVLGAVPLGAARCDRVARSRRLPHHLHG